VSTFARTHVFGVPVTPCTYETAVDAIIAAASEHRSYGVAALAVHGLMTAVDDAVFRAALERLDLVTPDGQPVRWALNLQIEPALGERVYGPDLTEKVCEAAEREGIGIYLFGSTERTCNALVAALGQRYPKIQIVGVQPDRFREATPEEDADDVARIVASGAGIVLVGRGCPRQERWVAEHLGRVPAAMLAVGAAFDYIAGTLAAPPRWMQRSGLEWVHRLTQEPRRLWRRYLVTNTQFLAHFVPLWFQRRLLRRPA
jgi:N-acetylglucosaminyldiphosphoundecaprenol N-acetyl-beta-D-mannosaminyltransferase